MSKKGMIVLDKIPKCCDKCDFEVFYSKCRAKNDALVDDRYSRPDACPIKEIPNYMVHDPNLPVTKTVSFDYANGFNDCIDQILN